MNVTATRIVETCLDDTASAEVTLDSPTTRHFIRYLAVLGTLEYFPGFARPFFRVTRDGAFIIKGVEGEEMFRVFIIHNTDAVTAEIASVVNGYIY